VIAAAFAVLVTAAALAILMTSTFLTVLVTTAGFTILVITTALAILMTSTFLTVFVTTAGFTILVITAALAALVVAAALTIAVTAASAATAALLGTTASRQFGTCSRISLHIVGVVAQLADLLTQLVGIGLLGIIVDGQFGGLHVVGVRLHTLEIRHILFEFVGALLTNAIGLDGHGLLPFGGRFLSAHAQGDEAY